MCSPPHDSENLTLCMVAGAPPGRNRLDVNRSVHTFWEIGRAGEKLVER